tara:strand:+ start:2701 stop:2964 length:264 start_codon:yes stop_codon:yes gene_type:complete
MPIHYGKAKPMTKGKSKPMTKGKTKPMTKGTHKMPDGTIMTGKTHTKDSKPVEKKKKKKNGKATASGKGSQAMKDKMAKLRAMKGKK